MQQESQSPTRAWLKAVPYSRVNYPFSEKNHWTIIDKPQVEIDEKNLGMINEIQYIKYNDKNFFPNLRTKMIWLIIKRVILYLIIIGLVLYSKLKKG